VRDDVERRVPVDGLLHEPRDRDALRGELVREALEDASAVVDREPQVPARGKIARREPLELPPHGVVLEEARVARPDDRDEIGDDRARRLDPAGARPLERDLTDRVALEHHRVERPLDGSERMVDVDERRADTRVDEPVRQRRPREELDLHVERPRRLDVLLRQPLDALDLDPLERDARAERDRREDRELRGRVAAPDVVGRIGLRVAELLRLLERLCVAAAVPHRREDEVRRSVDDADDAVDVRRDERLAQHLDHGNRGAHGCLEAELGARCRGGREQLRAAAGDELLVRGDDRAARAE
jgi:hypothetical protein